MNSHPLIEIEALERAFQREEELMVFTDGLAAFRSTPEGRAFFQAHLKHTDRLYARYEALCRRAVLSIKD